MQLKQHTLDITAFAAQNWLIDSELRDLMFMQLAREGRIVLSLDETPVHYTDYNWAYYSEAPKKNSTAVLTISGVIYDYYAQYVCMKLQAIAADKNVSRVLVKLNSPGGSADAGYRISDALMNLSIPTWCHIDFGQASSAGYMIACSCDGISASRANDRVGSIGTYVQYQDWSKYYAQLGIVSKNIYAEQSTEKNIEGREAEKGNFKPLTDYVSQEASAFIDYVKSRRTTLNTSKMDPFKGKVFSATDAQAIGLIDSINDLKTAVQLLNSTTTKTNATPRTTMIFGYVKAEKLLAFKGIEASALTTEMVKSANEELAALGINAVALISQAEFTAMMEANQADPEALTKAQAEVTRLTTALNAAQTSVGNLTTERDQWKTKAEEYGAKNGAEKTNGAKAEEKAPDADDADDTATILAGLEHNKQLVDMPWLNK
ncbi:S49 family peptidase [Spirosoma sordidisoli]|uniref:Peptidase S49 domain-containing protein n=1 Tax=Spirosoma sordidisoli TaxID=2502893 RepID=A0A4Q2UQ40_9BACT|nr:S49 family peptidase [Spirosoma sordidisoli]RYC69765.1 hypothetical protein EQG79_14310 [Spirosoma sordidisoli]